MVSIWLNNILIIIAVLVKATVMHCPLQCLKLKKFLVTQKCSKNFPPYIIYYNFYLPMVKCNWSSPMFGCQGRQGDTAISKVGTCGTCRSKQSWLPWCLMPIGTIQQSNNMNTQSTVLTNNSVVVASSLTGNEDGTPNKTSWVQVWISHFCWVSVSVFECTRSSCCGSSGLCAVLLITGLCFQLLLKTSLWLRMPVAAQWC